MLATSVSATMVSSGSRMELVSPVVQTMTVARMRFVLIQTMALTVIVRKDTLATEGLVWWEAATKILYVRTMSNAQQQAPVVHA